MTIAVTNVATTETFGAWLTKTNTLATIVSQNVVTVDSTINGSISTGNGYVNGFFGANTLLVYTGAAATPSLTFTGNTDTGIYRSATATVAIAAAGAQKMSANSTVVAVINATFSVSNNVAVTGNATFSNTIAVTGNTTLSNTLTVAGSATLSSNVSTAGTILINSVAHQFANTYTFNNSASAANIDTVSTSTYRSYEYTVQLSDTTVAPTPYYHVTKISIIHDGTNPYVTEYGTLFNIASLGSFDAIISGGNIALRLTPTTANVVAKFIRTSIVP